MSILIYRLKVKPGIKISDEDNIRLAIKRMRRYLLEADVNDTVIGFLHSYGVTVLIDPNSNPEKLTEEFKEAKSKVGKTCPKTFHTTVGPARFL